MKKLLTVIVFLAALGGVLYLATRMRSEPVAMPGEVIETVDQPIATQETKTIKEETPAYTIDVDYRLSGIAAVDAKIEATVIQSVNAFKADAANFDPAVESRPYTFSGEIADLYVGGNIVSERINLYQDTGGAHGMPIVLALNYDAKTGEEITLNKILPMIGETLPSIAAKSLVQLKSEYGDDSVFVDGAAAKPENYATYTIGAYNVTFIFQAYQVVAYAAGMPEIKFSIKD